MIERYEFWEKYGIRPTKVDGLKVGEKYVDKKKGLCLEVRKREKDKTTGFASMVSIWDGKELIDVDLAPHWERGPEGDIKICREGAMSLVRGVYAQTVKDYIDLFIGGTKKMPCKKAPWENKKEFEERRLDYYKSEIKKCEDFLGPVFLKFTKVKALWGAGYDIKGIAEKLNIPEYNAAAIVERLGFNRKDKPDDFDL